MNVLAFHPRHWGLAITLGLCLLAGMILSSCDPYGFYMGEKHIVTCRVITGLHSVDQGRYVCTLRDTGAVDFSYPEATQYKITLNARLTSGAGMRVMLRPVVEQWNVRDSGVVLTVTTTGSSVDTGGKTFYRSHARMDVGTTYPVLLISENNYTALVVGCDTVYQGLLKLKESDDVVFQALPKSELVLINPDWGRYDSERTEW